MSLMRVCRFIKFWVTFFFTTHLAQIKKTISVASLPSVTYLHYPWCLPLTFWRSQIAYCSHYWFSLVSPRAALSLYTWFSPVLDQSSTSHAVQGSVNDHSFSSFLCKWIRLPSMKSNETYWFIFTMLVVLRRYLVWIRLLKVAFLRLRKDPVNGVGLALFLDHFLFPLFLANALQNVVEALVRCIQWPISLPNYIRIELWFFYHRVK